jgi:predicted ATPase
MLNRRAWVYQNCTPRLPATKGMNPQNWFESNLERAGTDGLSLTKLYIGEVSFSLTKGGTLLLRTAHQFFVLTGGPGSGKSSLIEALERLGYRPTVEAGRGIIQDQVNIGGQGLPWADRALFAELMLSWEMRSYHIAQEQPGIVFFDRGVPDVIGYLRLIRLPVPPHMIKAAEEFRYSKCVFIAPPWKEIFHPDQERKQNFEEAVLTYESLAETYKEFGYGLVELPRVSVEDRVQFVLRKVAELGL